MRYLNLMLLIGVMLAAECFAEDAYYIFNGRKIPLVESDTLLAFQYDKEQSEDISMAVAGKSTIPKIDQPLLEAEYGIILVPRAQSGQPSSDDMGSLFGLPAPKASVPIYKAPGGVQMLLINEFLIQFAGAIDYKAAQKFIEDEKEVGAKILRDERDIGLYTVAFPPEVALKDALKKINDLNAHARVRYAQPEFIRRYPPRIPQAEAKKAAQTTEDSGAANVVAHAAAPGSACQVSIASSTYPDPNDEFFGNQWALKNTGANPVNNTVPGGSTLDADIDAVEAWDKALNASAEVTIAVIDLGVDMEHPDLVGRMGPSYDVYTQGNDANPKDHDYHGTAVAGIAAATFNNNAEGIAGVAPKARILPVKITSTPYAGGAWIAFQGMERNAIRAAVDLGAKVLVNSWGVGVPDAGIYDAVAYAIASNRIVVFSAGQHGRSAVENPDGTWSIVSEANSVHYPAAWADEAPEFWVRDAIIAVSATNQKDQFKTHDAETEFAQSVDSEPTWGSNRGPAISLAAPGIFIYTTDNTARADQDGYTCFGMTSAAAPFVAGAAALLLSVHPTATPKQIKDWLQAGTDPGFGQAAASDDYYGHGRLNADQSLDIAQVNVALEVQNVGDRIRLDEQRWVSATVTRGGQPAPNVPVVFTTPNSGLLEVVSSPIFFSNISGVAKARVQGTTIFPRTTEIRAQADGEQVKKEVEVPALTTWGIGLVAFIASACIVLRRRGHLLPLLIVLSVAGVASADVTGLIPLNEFLQPLGELTAAALVMVLEVLQFEVARNGTLVSVTAEFDYEVTHLCAAFWPVILLSTLILIDRSVTVNKPYAILLGVAMLVSLNIMRLINLFWIGVSIPDQFEVMHDVIWPGIMVLAMGALWLSLRKFELAPHAR